MAFTPRLTAPGTDDKRWIKTTYGGYNHCIQIGSDGSVLPNCTGYVHGRWMEIGNTNTDYDLSLGDATTYYSRADGVFNRGSTPKLGAVVCFSSVDSTGAADAGHVCIVEEIASDGSYIVCSESDYGGARFTVRTRYKEYGWNPGSTGWLTTFQGFIYHPDISGSSSVWPTPGPQPEEKKHAFIFIPRRKKRWQ